MHLHTYTHTHTSLAQLSTRHPFIFLSPLQIRQRTQLLHLLSMSRRDVRELPSSSSSFLDSFPLYFLFSSLNLHFSLIHLCPPLLPFSFLSLPLMLFPVSSRTLFSLPPVKIRALRRHENKILNIIVWGRLFRVGV